MNLTPDQKRIIQSVVNVFETGSAEGDYAKISIFADGAGNSRQITYGRAQTTEQGNLLKLLQIYVNNKGVYANALLPYIIKLQDKKPLWKDDTFKQILRDAGKEDPIMRTTQDEFFDLAYWQKAYEWAIKNSFKLPLSMLVIYDSFIHSGSIPMWLRTRFDATPPSSPKGDEKKWVTQYVNTRHSWLKNHPTRPILRNTIYRTQTFLNEIKRDNWNLSKLPIVANGVKVS